MKNIKILYNKIIFMDYGAARGYSSITLVLFYLINVAKNKRKVCLYSSDAVNNHKMIEYNRYRPSDQINDPSTETPTTTPGAPTSVWVTAETELMQAPPQPDAYKEKDKNKPCTRLPRCLPLSAPQVPC